MENEQKQDSIPKQSGGCGCRGGGSNFGPSQPMNMPPDNLMEEKQALASLIKAVHERKNKISKTRSRNPL